MSAPLQGLHVLDFTQTWAGPLATRILGDLGADVLKVEAPQGRGSRGQPVGGAILPLDQEETTDFWELHGLFHELNRNKRSLVVDMGKPGAIALIQDLVRWADVVIDNFSARVMSNFGLDHATLRQLNPSVIALSMPAYGLSGPYAHAVGYGPTMEAASGLAWNCRYEDLDEPFRCGPAYPDPVAGLNAAFAILLSLFARDRAIAGGNAIDLSQMECAVATIGENIVADQIGEPFFGSRGDRHSHFAPWTSFLCGDGRWLFIGIESERQWQAIVTAATLPVAMADLSEVERRERLTEIEGALSAWAAGVSAPEAESLLSRAGVPAAVVASGADLLTNEQLAGQGAFIPVEHPRVSTRLQPTFPVVWDDSAEWERYQAAPLYGEALEWVADDLLGLSEEAITGLIASGVLLREPPPA